MRIFITIILLSLVALLHTGCATKIPMMAVQLSDDGGTNVSPITKGEITQWVDSANKSWGSAGYKITFGGKKDMVKVSSTVLNTQPPDNAYDQWELYRIAGNYLASLLPSEKIPVFFRKKGSSGWSWGPGDTNYISMPSYGNTCISKAAKGSKCPNGCCPNDTLLSHQLGHYFGLAHTFTDTPCDQVTLANTDGDRNGQLSGTTKDDVSDTTPDPGAACAPTTSLTCKEKTVTVNGVKFTPPWQNIMSYHECTPEKISAGQKMVIQNSLTHPWRSRLGK